MKKSKKSESVVLKTGTTMRSRIIVCFLAALLVCLLLSTVSVLSEASAAESKYGGTLRVGVLMPQYKYLDARYMSVAAFAPAAEMIYDGLLDFGKEGYTEPVPMLATSFQTKDNKMWVFNLRKGVKFHNGREMTAQDVKTNLDWLIETPKGHKPHTKKGYFKELEKVEIINNYSVKITCNKPFAPLPRLLATQFRGFVPPEEVEKYGDDLTFHPVGTGPFKAAEVSENKVVLERFKDYWGPKPYIDRVEYIFYRSDESRVIALQAGEIDVAFIDDNAKPVLKKDTNIAIYEITIPEGLNRMNFNLRRWPMNDIRFRKAVWMGVDWKTIGLNSYPYKSGNPSRTFLEYTKYFNPEAVKLVPSYNQKEAKLLLQAVEKDAGKKIPPLYWLDSDQPERRTVAEMAKAMFAEIGLQLNLQLLPRGIFQDKLMRDPKIEWDIGQGGLGFGQDPYVGFTYYLTNSETGADGKSLPGYSSPEMDQYVSKAMAATKEVDRVKYYQEAEKVLLKDAVAITISPTRQLIAVNKKVKGFIPHGAATIYVTRSWANMWIER
jgi:peptide/nickel transport system substrate-binding protein